MSMAFVTLLSCAVVFVLGVFVRSLIQRQHGYSVWVRLVLVVPSLIATVVIFDQQISDAAVEFESLQERGKESKYTDMLPNVDLPEEGQTHRQRVEADMDVVRSTSTLWLVFFFAGFFIDESFVQLAERFMPSGGTSRGGLPV